MAAIDPSAAPQVDEEHKVPRATLKIIRVPMDFDDDEDDEDYDPEDVEAIVAKLRANGALPDADSDMSEDDSEDEKNGGPSDPAKSKKAMRAAIAKKLQKDLEDEDMEIDSVATGKGKAKATDDDISDDDDDEDDDEDDEAEEFVLCTLDPEKVRHVSSLPAIFPLNTRTELPADARHHCP